MIYVTRYSKKYLKGCGMGPWLVLVSLFLFPCFLVLACSCFLVLVSLFSCFRENVVATCKIGSFLCSLGDLLQKNVIVLFFGNQISKWCSFKKKKAILTYFSHFLVTREKLQNFLQHISHSHTYTYFAHPIDFLPYQFWKKKIRIYQVRFLFGMSPGVDSYSRHFGIINN